MIIYMNELEELQCILNTIKFEDIDDEPCIFTEDTIVDFVETILLLMDEYMNENPTIITEPDFYDILQEDIKELLYIQFEEHILSSLDDSVEEDMDEILYSVFQIYISCFWHMTDIYCRNYIKI